MTSEPDAPLNLDRLLDEAVVLRGDLALPKIDEGPVELVNRLTVVRLRLDRVEEILSALMRFRGQVRASHKVAAADFEDAWASQVVAVNRRSRGASDGWGSAAPRERYADADLATLDQKRALRRLERMLDRANDAVEIVKGVHRSLDSVRMDLHLILRAMSVETALER